jgi:hypothetical protein
MTPESTDFIEKLRHMEEQANAVSAHLAPSVERTRLVQIVVLAQTLRSRLESGRLTVEKAER